MTQVIENTGEPVQDFLSPECRLLDRYEIQGDLVETLGYSRHRALAPRVESCHRSFRHWRCENNHDWAEAENSCCVRVCPHCSRRRSLILAGRIQKHIMGREGLRYVVLAERNCENLQDGMRSLWEAWSKLRRSVQWQVKVKGCIVALEVTRNAKDGTWHPHLNVLMEGDYFPFALLNRLWIRATRGNGKTSHIQAADAGTVRELIKYVTKISDLLGQPAALDEFLDVLTRKRTVRTYGTFYGIAVDDEENPGVECPDCGSHTSIRLGHVHPSQVSFDFEKEAFRVRVSPRTDFHLKQAESFDVNSFGMEIRTPFASVSDCFGVSRQDRRGEWKHQQHVTRWESLQDSAAIATEPRLQPTLFAVGEALPRYQMPD